jgi:hypothetical protein
MEEKIHHVLCKKWKKWDSLDESRNLEISMIRWTDEGGCQLYLIKQETKHFVSEIKSVDRIFMERDIEPWMRN